MNRRPAPGSADSEGRTIGGDQMLIVRHDLPRRREDDSALRLQNTGHPRLQDERRVDRPVPERLGNGASVDRVTFTNSTSSPCPATYPPSAATNKGAADREGSTSTLNLTDPGEVCRDGGCAAHACNWSTQAMTIGQPIARPVTARPAR